MFEQAALPVLPDWEKYSNVGQELQYGETDSIEKQVALTQAIDPKRLSPFYRHKRVNRKTFRSTTFGQLKTKVNYITHKGMRLALPHPSSRLEVGAQ